MFKKFGNIKFGGEKIRQSSNLNNINPSSSSGTINHVVFHENIYDSVNEFSFLPAFISFYEFYYLYVQATCSNSLPMFHLLKHFDNFILTTFHY